MQSFDLFLTAPPGLEPVLADEARAAGFADPAPQPGGVATSGTLQEAWRANLVLRGAGRVLLRFASFRAVHLAQLDKRARKVAWAEVLRGDVPVRVDVTCRKSKIYHDRAARQRIERAISETLGAPLAEDAELRVMARIEDDLVTMSVDTSGAPLHQRGHKEAVGKAPMRETLAALFLRQAGFDGAEPVIDPMCGSGTFVLEAAAWSAGLHPGRTRGFAFERLASFDQALWDRMKAAHAPEATPGAPCFFGFDRDDGAIRNATANAGRAGVADLTQFTRQAISDLQRPDGAPGLVIVNPPYGARIGNRKLLFSLYGALGQVLQERFKGWRAAIVTSDGGLAKATRLPFRPPGPPVAHGGLSVKLYQTGALR